MKRFIGPLTTLVLLAFALPAFAAEEEEVAHKFLGLPVELWKLANLLLILAFLVYFLGRPLKTHFRKRREDLDEALARAAAERDRAVSLASEMTAKVASLEKEVAEIRRRGAEEGEREKKAQLEAAVREAESLRRNAADEIERRLASAKHELAAAAADLAAGRAREALAAAITDEDRRRLLDESVQNVSRAS